VHPGVRAAFSGHSVRTVSEAGWRSNKDRVLVHLAEREVDVLVTIDRNIEHEVDLHSFQLGVVFIRVVSNTLAAYLPNFPRLRRAVEIFRKGEVLQLDIRPHASSG
jgi:hypothetical protein